MALQHEKTIIRDKEYLQSCAGQAFAIGTAPPALPAARRGISAASKRRRLLKKRVSCGSEASLSRNSQILQQLDVIKVVGRGG